MEKLEPIKCEVKLSPEDKTIFHLTELKTGRNKLVAYGRTFPIEGTKKFLRRMEKEYGIEVVNKRDFFTEVKAYVKTNKQK